MLYMQWSEHKLYLTFYVSPFIGDSRYRLEPFIKNENFDMKIIHSSIS
jgi:hypothetical protein